MPNRPEHNHEPHPPCGGRRGCDRRLGHRYHATAHGFAGDRFFPATIQTDDPFVADEMSLPTVTLNPPGIDGSRETDVGTDISKRITPDLGITLSDQWKYITSKGVPARYGFDALETGVQYQLFVNAPHEAMALVGLDASWAHTGRVQAVGAPDFTTLSPTLDFGKGFGDLPASLPWLRPLAITGNLSVDFPTKTQSDGTPNPNIPYGNGAQGRGVGALVQLHFFLDDLFPHSIGRPLLSM